MVAVKRGREQTPISAKNLDEILKEIDSLNETKQKTENENLNDTLPCKRRTATEGITLDEYSADTPIYLEDVIRPPTNAYYKRIQLIQKRLISKKSKYNTDMKTNGRTTPETSKYW